MVLSVAAELVTLSSSRSVRGWFDACIVDEHNVVESVHNNASIHAGSFSHSTDKHRRTQSIADHKHYSPSIPSISSQLQSSASTISSLPNTLFFPIQTLLVVSHVHRSLRNLRLRSYRPRLGSLLQIRSLHMPQLSASTLDETSPLLLYLHSTDIFGARYFRRGDLPGHASHSNGLRSNLQKRAVEDSNKRRNLNDQSL